MVTEKQKANLIPTSQRTPRERQEISRLGAKACNEVKSWKAKMQKCVGNNWDTLLDDPDMKAKLKKAGLPPTYFGQFIQGVTQRAAKNPMILRTLMEVMDMLPQNGTQVNVNNVPIIIGGEDELK